MKIKKIIAFVLFLLVPLAVGFLSSQIVGTDQSVQYANFNKPLFSPPSYLFGPVWTVLYLLMGLAAFLIWQKKNVLGRSHALAIFFLQLFFNFLWTPIFFGWFNFGLAFFEIIILLGLIIAMMMIFYKIKPLAGWLLIPYFLWVSFATILTFAVWQLN